MEVLSDPNGGRTNTILSNPNGGRTYTILSVHPNGLLRYSYILADFGGMPNATRTKCRETKIKI